MKRSVKLTIATAAFAAPILAGVAFTAASAVGVGGDGIFHTVDQWTIEEDGGDEYTIDREAIDGVVTIVVTGPDGSVLSEGEVPDYVAAEVAELGSPDWEPNELRIFRLVDGVGCYDQQALDHELSSNEVIEEGYFGATNTSDEVSFALEASADGDVDAAWFDGFVEQDVLRDQLESGESYLELGGAQPLNPCS